VNRDRLGVGGDRGGGEVDGCLVVGHGIGEVVLEGAASAACGAASAAVVAGAAKPAPSSRRERVCGWSWLVSPGEGVDRTVPA